MKNFKLGFCIVCVCVCVCVCVLTDYWREPERKTNIKRSEDEVEAAQSKPTGTQISSSTLCFVQQFSKRKMLCFIFSKNVNEPLQSWISRWQPITVILSVSMSSTLLTQPPQDGALARFNHPLTHSMMITHSASRQVDGCGTVTALSPHYTMIP